MVPQHGSPATTRRPIHPGVMHACMHFSLMDEWIDGGVVWCGVVWCGVVWCGVVWCGVEWCGVEELMVVVVR